MRILRLTHPALPFWVDVRVMEHDGRWLAVADLADEPDIGMGNDPRQAVAAALASLGEPYVSEMTRRADLTSEGG